MNSISEGDEVLTNSGLLGTIVKISNTGYVSLALNSHTEVIMKKDFIIAILPKNTLKLL